MEGRKPREDPGESKKREERVRLLVGRLSCLIGVLLGSGCVVSALLGVRPNVSAAVVGIGLGVVGHFLGARRLATVTVVLGVVALLIGLATIEGLIPGIEPYDQERPSARYPRDTDHRRFRAAIICRDGHKGFYPLPRGAPGEVSQGFGALGRRA